MDERDKMRWTWRGCALGVLVIGWGFIAWKNHFHITAPVVFVCLGYLAVVATVYNLWRTGAAAVAGSEDDSDSTWAKPAGALGELEREKRTLLKAIKEAEFDHQMGKLSQRDVDDMIRTYRARAIEVIKEIDRLGHGAEGTTREQIMREVRARLELEAKSQKRPEPKPETKPETKTASSPDAKSAGKGKKKPGKAAGMPEPSPSGSTSTSGSTSGTEVLAAGSHAGNGEAVAAATKALDDDLNADSTTTVEPTRDESAKEATP